MDHLFLERNFFLLGRAFIYLKALEDRDSPLQSGYQRNKEAKKLVSFFVDFSIWFI